MYIKYKSKIYIYLLITGLLTILIFSGCDNYQTIIYDNQTKSIIKPFLGVVSRNYSGNPNQEYVDPKVTVEPGQSRKFTEPISRTRDNGDLRKYVVVIKNEKDDIIFSRVFTWDELHDMNWRIIITEKD